MGIRLLFPNIPHNHYKSVNPFIWVINGVNCGVFPNKSWNYLKPPPVTKRVTPLSLDLMDLVGWSPLEIFPLVPYHTLAPGVPNSPQF